VDLECKSEDERERWIKSLEAWRLFMKAQTKTVMKFNADDY